MRVGRATGKDWLRLGEAATALGVSPNTLRRWSDAGGITCYRSPGGHRRFRRADVQALLEDEDNRPTTRGREQPGAALPSDPLAVPLALSGSTSAGPLSARAGIHADGQQDDVTLDSPATPRHAPGVSPTTMPAMSTESLVLTALTVLRMQPVVAACTLYRFEGSVAAPFPAGDRDGNPVDHGGAWHLSHFATAGQAVAERRPLVVTPEASESPGRQVTARFLTDRGLFSVVLAPVVFKDHLVGLLEMGATTPEDLEQVRHIALATADVLAAALGGEDVIARLQRRSRDLALVVEAGLEDTARLSTDDVLHAVAERLSTLTSTPVADIYAVEGDALRALVSYDGGHFDTEWAGVVLPLSRYPCSRTAVQTGEITIVATLDDPALDEDDRQALERWGYQAELSMPLISRRHVLGVVELSDYRPRDFAEDLDLIRGLGQVAAHALENASFFEEVDRRNRILNELVELGALVTRSHDLDELVRTVAERVLSAVEAANCDIYRMVQGTLRCVASFDRSGHDESVLGKAFDLSRFPTAAEAMQAHHVLTIASPDDPQLSEVERAVYRDYGFTSEVCLPLVVNDQLYGMLDVYDTRERDFSEHLSFLRSAAHTLAGAFENASLLDQLEQRTTILSDIVDLAAAASQARDLQGFLTVLGERLRDTIGATDCDISALQDGKLRRLVSLSRDGQKTGAAGQLLDMARFPATALAVRTGEPVAITALDDSRLTPVQREDMTMHGYQSELCIPLIRGERVIGIIDIFDIRPRDYGEYPDFLRSVGQIAAGAIENALSRTAPSGDEE